MTFILGVSTVAISGFFLGRAHAREGLDPFVLGISAVFGFFGAAAMLWGG